MEAKTTRNIKQGLEYNQYFPIPDGNERLVSKNGNVAKTVQTMADVVKRYKSDCAPISKLMKGKSKLDTCRNIYNFICDHIQYEIDPPGHEVIRRPAVTWAHRKGDCDCQSVFISSILHNLSIDHYFTTAGYEGGQGEYQHVYVTVPDGPSAIIIDTVLQPVHLGLSGNPSMFNKEKISISKKHYTMSELGIPISILSGIEPENVLEFKPNNKANNDGLMLLTAMRSVQKSTYDGILDNLKATQQYVSLHPEVLGNMPVNCFMECIKHVIAAWDYPTRNSIVYNAAMKEAEYRKQTGSNFNFFTRLHETISGNPELSGVFDLDWTDYSKGYDCSSGVIKIGSINEVNPVFIAFKLAFILLIKNNYMGWATRLAIGYAFQTSQNIIPTEEALAKVAADIGASESGLRKYAKSFRKLACIFRAGGGVGNSWQNFKQAIKDGRNKGAAIGKYEETRKLRQHVLPLVENSIKKIYKLDVLKGLDNTSDLGVTGIEEAIAAAAPYIAVAATVVGSLEDAADLLKNGKNAINDILPSNSGSSASTVPDFSTPSTPSVPGGSPNTTNTTSAASMVKPALIVGGLALTGWIVKDLISGKNAHNQ